MGHRCEILTSTNQCTTLGACQSDIYLDGAGSPQDLDPQICGVITEIACNVQMKSFLLYVLLVGIKCMLK